MMIEPYWRGLVDSNKVYWTAIRANNSNPNIRYSRALVNLDMLLRLYLRCDPVISLNNNLKPTRKPMKITKEMEALLLLSKDAAVPTDDESTETEDECTSGSDEE